MTATISSNECVVEKIGRRVYLIAGSRVPLDTVVYWFHNGATAEEITDKYQTLSLASVYGSIAHSLNHRETIDLDLRWPRRRPFETAQQRRREEPCSDLVGRGDSEFDAPADSGCGRADIVRLRRQWDLVAIVAPVLSRRCDQPLSHPSATCSRRSRRSLRRRRYQALPRSGPQRNSTAACG